MMRTGAMERRVGSGVFGRVLKLRSGRLALYLLAGTLVLSLFGPLLAPDSPLQGSSDVLQHPSVDHWLGTDYLGRDVLSRLLHGSPLSVFGAAMVTLIAFLVGVVPGVLSVYLGRTFEWLSLRLVDTLIALPFLLFAVSMTALLGNGIVQAMIVVGILVAPGCYRVARAATLRVARSPYVEAAILAGASHAFIIRKHVLGKMLPPVAIMLAGTMRSGLIVVASLTFLGIGVRPPEPTWGGLLASDLGYLSYRPYAPLFPTSLIMLTVWAFNLLGDAIRDVSGEAGLALLEKRSAEEEPSEPAPSSRSGTALRAVHALDSGAKANVLLSVSDLDIRHKLSSDRLVRGVSFSLERGRALGIVGESGSGKTLTCRAVLGILPERLELSAGSIGLLGKNIAEFSRSDWNQARGRVISAVFQDPASYLNPAFRVGKQIEEILRVKERLGRRAAKARVLSLFEALRLRDPELVFEQYPHELSGGMLQRVLIAAAIAQTPAILVADEATTALDVTIQAEVLDVLVDLKERLGLALIVVSHDLAVVAQVCDEVLVMRAGEVVEYGSVERVLSSPEHEYTRLLIEEHASYALERFVPASEPGKLEHAS